MSKIKKKILGGGNFQQQVNQFSVLLLSQRFDLIALLSIFLNIRHFILTVLHRAGSFHFSLSPFCTANPVINAPFRFLKHRQPHHITPYHRLLHYLLNYDIITTYNYIERRAIKNVKKININISRRYL